MSGVTTILALSENQSAWWYTLAAGHAIDDQTRPIEPEIRGINGALQKVADALTTATR